MRACLGVAVAVAGVGEGGAQVGTAARVHEGQPVSFLFILFVWIGCLGGWLVVDEKRGGVGGKGVA